MQARSTIKRSLCDLKSKRIGFEGRFRVTRQEKLVEREWFRVTSEWKYAGRLELSVLYVREGTLH
jgi:hypothetical protein